MFRSLPEVKRHLGEGATVTVRPKGGVPRSMNDDNGDNDEDEEEEENSYWQSNDEEPVLPAYLPYMFYQMQLRRARPNLSDDEVGRRWDALAERGKRRYKELVAAGMEGSAEHAEKYAACLQLAPPRGDGRAAPTARDLGALACGAEEHAVCCQRRVYKEYWGVEDAAPSERGAGAEGAAVGGTPDDGGGAGARQNGFAKEREKETVRTRAPDKSVDAAVEATSGANSGNSPVTTGKVLATQTSADGNKENVAVRAKYQASTPCQTRQVAAEKSSHTTVATQPHDEVETSEHIVSAIPLVTEDSRKAAADTEDGGSLARTSSEDSILKRGLARPVGGTASPRKRARIEAFLRGRALEALGGAWEKPAASRIRADAPRVEEHTSGEIEMYQRSALPKLDNIAERKQGKTQYASTVTSGEQVIQVTIHAVQKMEEFFSSVVRSTDNPGKQDGIDCAKLKLKFKEIIPTNIYLPACSNEEKKQVTNNSFATTESNQMILVSDVGNKENYNKRTLALFGDQTKQENSEVTGNSGGAAMEKESSNEKVNNTNSDSKHVGIRGDQAGIAMGKSDSTKAKVKEVNVEKYTVDGGVKIVSSCHLEDVAACLRDKETQVTDTAVKVATGSAAVAENSTHVSMKGSQLWQRPNYMSPELVG